MTASPRRVAWLFAVGLAALVHAQGPGPAIPKGTNVMAGRVLDVANDAPIGGAIVTVTGYLDSSGQPSARLPAPGNPSTTSPRSVMTTPGGDFVFRDLPAGRYAIAGAAFGYANNGYALQFVDLGNSDKPLAVSVRLWKHASISGTVRDDHGEPVVGVAVSALRRVVVGGAVKLSGEGTDAATDDRGDYRIGQLPPGNYVVGVSPATTALPASLAADVDVAAASGQIVTDLLKSGAPRLRTGAGMRVGELVLQRSGPPPVLAPDGRWLAYPSTFAPHATLAEATVIALGSGESRSGVDVALLFSPTVRVAGTAIGPDGPIGNLALRLMPPDGGNPTEMDPPNAMTAITDAKGAFTFLTVSPGQYVLRSSLTAEATPTSAAVSLWTSQPVTVGETDVIGVVATMKPGVRISGHVELDGLAVPPPGNWPRIVVGRRPIGAMAWRTIQSAVRPDGTFATDGDPPGRYVLYVATGATGWIWQGVARNGRVLTDDVIELESTDLSDLVVTFSNKTTRVSGMIADAKGAPDAETVVVVFPADSSFWREGILNSRRVRTMPATSAAGYEFNELAPGEYYIAAVSSRVDADWSDPLLLERLVPGSTKVTLGPGDEKTVPLKTFVLREH